jgi:hypothetical protein
MRYLVGSFFLLFAGIHARRISKWLREGEAFLVIDAAGEGLLGGAGKSDQPKAFWFNVALNSLIAIAAACFGIAFLTGLMDA